ncbi:hypothetical protein R1sor_002325 [Riccia sorocarpa]|uniref:Reverse transcriptase domain-containing protein n=1 Tax=Riccia sorocarpa TaxID=122646 RepID=A0ABD3GYH3_9MARC
METERTRWVQQKVDAKWVENGDIPSKVFFGMFKARQKMLEVNCLLNEEGEEVTEQSGMEKLAERHFQKLLAEDRPDEDRIGDIGRILQRTHTGISNEDKEALDAPITKEELFTATTRMKNGKSPGPDGTPVEFFAALWETAGSLVAQVVARGADKGFFPDWFNRGDIVLLPKEGDARLLSNKRPITLLNTLYKMYTKVLQTRIVPVLQKIIHWNQSAFLPGRNIHTSVLICNEAIHTAKETGADFIVLQLDFKKAFDSVNWRFLEETLKVFNFGDRFQGYIKAILHNAASSVIVNGKRSMPVRITRSVRQGCPLSPLLFILATQTLTTTMEHEVNSGRIQGVFLQRANVHYSLGLYADDSHVIFRAHEEGARCMKNLLDSFGNASGLQIQWNKSAARWIGAAQNNRPSWAAELDWAWKGAGEATKLLGFSFEEGIKPEEMLSKCKRKINEVCSNAMYGSLSIYGRITVANAVLLGVFWYLIPLWAGEIEELQKMEKQIVSFVWSGASLETRNRAATKIIVQKTKVGGLGLISLSKQHMAFTARTIRWAYQPGEHPIQKMIRRHIEEENMEAYGLKKIITHGTLHTKKDWEEIPIWGSDREAVDGKIRKANSQARKLLWEDGYERLGDLTTADGQVWASWEERKIRGNQQATVQTAFRRLTENIKVPGDATLKAEEIIKACYESTDQPGIVWEWSTKGGQKLLTRAAPSESEEGRSYKEVSGALVPCKPDIKPIRESVFCPVKVVTFRTGQGKTLRVREQRLPVGAGELANLRWNDGKQFFAASNGSIREMLSADKKTVEDRVRRWNGLAEILPENPNRWRKIWKAGRARRESFLLWSISLKIVPTNGWRFPGLPRLDSQRWCKRCEARTVEDVFHTFWNCTKTQIIWKPIAKFVSNACRDKKRCEPKCSHFLLAEDIPRELKALEDWWKTLRGAMIWSIWLARNARNFNSEVWHPRKINSLIWYRMAIYIRSEWKKLQSAEKEDFQTNWRFEISGIVVDERGRIQLSKEAPWSRRREPTQNGERGGSVARQRVRASSVP